MKQRDLQVLNMYAIWRKIILVIKFKILLVLV